MRPEYNKVLRDFKSWAKVYHIDITFEKKTKKYFPFEYTVEVANFPDDLDLTDEILETCDSYLRKLMFLK